mmetsp:Transcript_17220/g.37187  ORF Transcript_17220/g.37187 Transcript_17220/m.37187 type:complete len:229 (-) Transcript_17220:353-1039(-)
MIHLIIPDTILTVALRQRRACGISIISLLLILACISLHSKCSTINCRHIRRIRSLLHVIQWSILNNTVCRHHKVMVPHRELLRGTSQIPFLSISLWYLQRPQGRQWDNNHTLRPCVYQQQRRIKKEDPVANAPSPTVPTVSSKEENASPTAQGAKHAPILDVRKMSKRRDCAAPTVPPVSGVSILGVPKCPCRVDGALLMEQRRRFVVWRNVPSSLYWVACARSIMTR